MDQLEDNRQWYLARIEPDERPPSDSPAMTPLIRSDTQSATSKKRIISARCSAETIITSGTSGTEETKCVLLSRSTESTPSTSLPYASELYSQNLASSESALNERMANEPIQQFANLQLSNDLTTVEPKGTQI